MTPVVGDDLNSSASLNTVHVGKFDVSHVTLSPAAHPTQAYVVPRSASLRKPTLNTR